MKHVRIRGASTIACALLLAACTSSNESDDPAGPERGGSSSAVGDSGAAGESSGRAGEGGSAAGHAGTDNSSGMAGSDGDLPVSCSDDAPPPVRVRLVLPSDVEEPTPSSVVATDLQTEFHVDGTVRAVTQTSECEACAAPEPALSIEIESNEDGSIWTLLASPLELVESWETLASSLGDRNVSLMFRYRRLFQIELSTGFTLEDDQGTLLAAELGPRVQVLKPEDMSGFSVTPAEDLCASGDGCDLVVYRALVFGGDNSVKLGLGETGSFTIDGRPFAARNSGAVRYAGTCADFEKASPWSVWRASP